MTTEPAQPTPKTPWAQYALAGIGLLLSIGLMVVVIFFWEEIQNAKGYGYLTAFVVSLFGGVTIIPVPSLVVLFTLAHKVNPIYLALISGFGEAIGGITIYLTGTGGSVLWNKLRSKRPVIYENPHPEDPPSKHKVRSKWQAYYDRTSNFLSRKGGAWALFLTAAFIWWIYYPFALAAGTFRMGLKRFFLISWVGKTIRGFIVVLAGYYGLSFFIKWLGGG